MAPSRLTLFLIMLSLIQQQGLFSAMEVVNSKIPSMNPSQHRNHNTDRDLERKASKRKSRNREHDYYITSHANASLPNLNKIASHVEGVSMALLETARDRTLRNVPTSCADIIQAKFSNQSPQPLNDRSKIITDLEEKRNLMFLHIPKNGNKRP